MDISENLADWLFEQIEMLPSSFFRDKMMQQGQRRLFDQFYGEREAAELQVLLAQPTASGERPLTVLLPGIMGSLLYSVRGISALLWINPTLFLDGQVNLLELDDKGHTDKSCDVDITAVGIEKVFYLNLIITLAQRTRFFEFPYDWRRANEHSAELLHQALLRWSSGTKGQRFNLIGHSMGGVVIRTYLAMYPAEAERLVRRVILLASPLYGAPLAIAMLAGIARENELGRHLNPANNLSELAASFPSVYQLLPAPKEYFRPTRYYPADWNIYDAEAWGIPSIRQRHLDNAAKLYKRLDALEPQMPVIQIAGTGIRTVTDIRRDEGDDGPVFTPVYQEESDLNGDDRVPLYSAWDRRLRTYFVNEHHQRFTGNALVRQAVIDLVHDRQPALPMIPSAVSLSKPDTVTPIVRQMQEIKQRFERGTFTRDDLADLFWSS